jgi:hypothetical protein
MNGKTHKPHGILGTRDEGRHDQRKRNIQGGAKDNEVGGRHLPRPKRSLPKQWRQQQKLLQPREAHSCAAKKGKKAKPQRNKTTEMMMDKTNEGSVRKTPSKEKMYAISSAYKKGIWNLIDKKCTPSPNESPSAWISSVANCLVSTKNCTGITSFQSQDDYSPILANEMPWV